MDKCHQEKKFKRMAVSKDCTNAILLLCKEQQTKYQQMTTNSFKFQIQWNVV